MYIYVCYIHNLSYDFTPLFRFIFEAREWPNGHYVHTLYGKKEEPRG